MSRILNHCRGLGLCLSLIIASVPGGARLAAADEQTPMSYHGSAAEAAVHALTMIAAGDADAVAELPSGIWHSAVAIPDHDDADLALRWSRCLAASLARCPAERRPRILELIDAACQADLARHPLEPWRAADYLPAPSAIAALNRFSAQAFDHGRLLESLSAGAALPSSARSAPAQARLAAARALCGLDGTAGGPALEAPGEPQPVPLVHSSPTSSSSDQGLTVRWLRTPAYLLALSGGKTQWQYRVETNAETVTGPGGVLVRDDDGMRWLDEAGHTTTLASPPGTTRMLAIAGEAAWFATGPRAWRLPLSGGAPSELQLGEEPVAPPLVRGERSLWLLPDQLLLFSGAQELARIRHHLAVSASWRLEADPAGMALLIAPDGGCWTIAPLATAIVHAPLLEQARLLVAAHRGEEAIHRLENTPEAASAAGRATLFAAHCSLGARHVAAQVEQVAALASDPEQLIAVRLAAWKLAGQEAAPGCRTALLSALQAAPDAQISWSVDDLDRVSSDWDHLSTASVMQAALEAQATASPPRSPVPQPVLVGPIRIDVLPEALPAFAAVDESTDDPQLGRVHRYAGRLVSLSHGAGISELTCHTAGDHALAWRLRWPSDPEQPSRALALIDDTVVVAEGTSQLLLVDLRTGSMRGRVDCGELPADPSRCCIAGSTMAIPGPLNQDLAVASGLPSSAFTRPADLVAQVVQLPATARWLVPAPPLSLVLARLENGTARLYPGGDVAGLPQVVLASATAPLSWSRGLAVAGDFFRWSGSN